jgi:D-glycero-alpha-D-manno-heptose-7-phosphate kinase
LSAFKGEYPTNEEIAETAAHIELDVLGLPGGKQDHYATALGGTHSLLFKNDYVIPHRIAARREMISSLCLFFTGYSRDAREILISQNQTGLDFIKESAHDALGFWERGDVFRFGELMHEHWVAKQTRAVGMSNEHINELYKTALDNGAIGGKLVGAGGGGFLLFVTRDREKLVKAMAEAGLKETKFEISWPGTSIIGD